MKLKRSFFRIFVLISLCGIFALLANAAAAPKLEVNPASPMWPEGSAASWSCEISDGNSEFYDYRWFIVYKGTVYDACDMENLPDMPWYQYGDPELQFGIGPMENRYYISGISSELNGAEIYCMAENANGTVYSSHARIQVTDAEEPAPPEGLSMPAYYSVKQGESLVLTCTAKAAAGAAGSLHHLWFVSDTGSLSGIVAIDRGAETNATLKVDTSKPGARTYYCGVWTDGGKYENNLSYTGAVTVEVLEDTVSSVHITENPEKLTYKVGEKVDLKGLKLRVEGSPDSYDLSDFSELTVKPETFEEKGKVSVTLTYRGKSAAFEVEVKGREPEKPIIDRQPEGGVIKVGSEKAELSVEAHAEDEGTLRYAWYSSPDGNKANLKPVNYTDNPVLVLPQKEGTFYYCVYIWNCLDGVESEPTISGLIPVTFEAAAEEEEEQERQEEERPAEEFITAGETEDPVELPEENQVPPRKERKSFGVWAIVLFILVVLLAMGAGAFFIVRMVRSEKGEPKLKMAEKAAGKAARHPAEKAGKSAPAGLDETVVIDPNEIKTVSPKDMDETRVISEDLSAEALLEELSDGFSENS